MSRLIEHAGRPPAPPRTTPLATQVRQAIVRRRKLLTLLCVGLLSVVAYRASATGAHGADLEHALADALTGEGLEVDPASVLWIDGPDEVLRGAVFLAAGRGELTDLYYADVRTAGEQTVLDVLFLSNLSHTTSAEETQLRRVGERAVYASRVGNAFDAIVTLDPAGEPAELTAEWPARARFQSSVTRLQESGRTRGFGIRRYQLREPATALQLEVQDGHAVAVVSGLGSGDARIELDPGLAEPIEGGEHLEFQPQHRGMPETVPWLVDTVRNLSFVGPEPIEWLENRVYAVKDVLMRAYHGVSGPTDTASEVAEELAMPEEVSEERLALLTVTDPELGWPPAPLAPVITTDVVEGEGRWIPVVDDPFVNQYPNAPPAFYQTFLRADPERDFTRVYITVWDPRQVQLRIQSGVREPESATGQRGTGMVPREPDTMRRLVGAFNGGFQSLHGEFGMMADGRVYLPPKPWAATVVVMDDGRVGMGSWPAPNWNGRYYDESLANRQIPEDVVDLRQNLTSVVEDGVYNPWSRWYWGAAPRAASEQTMTARSAMCLTEEGFLAYYWGQGVGPEALGTAMIQTRCVRSVHLDMNTPHCGFEFFRPYAPSETPPPLSRRVDAESEYDGPFMRADRGWHLRARRAVRAMGMPFPRYSDQDARDFFYLTLRPTLPGPDVDGVALSAEGLPHAGWPHAFARGSLTGGGGRTWVVRIDPRRAVPAPLRRDDHTRALAHLAASAAPGEGPLALVARRRTVGTDLLVVTAPESDDVVLARGRALAEVPDADLALGVDQDGFLVYLERAGDARPLHLRIEALRLVGAIALQPTQRLGFAVADGHAGPDGFERELDTASAMALYAEERPASQVMFPDNTPQPYRVWGYLQDQRVRYFPDRDGDAPRFIRPNQ